MKILYLFSSAETSVAIVTLNQVKALRKFYPELDIKIACVNYYPERSVLEGEMDYIKKFNPNQIINYIQSLLFVKKVKKEFKPNVTISNLGAVNTFNALINANDFKVGIFHSPMKQFKTKNILARFLNYISIKKIYPKLNTLIGISEEVVSDLNKHIKSTSVKLFYNIHDIVAIKEKTNENVFIEFDKKVKLEILCLGTINRNKRQDLIIKTLATYPNKNFKLYIVGKVVEESYHKELLDLISIYKLTDQVEFIPFLSNPYPLIKRVDMLVSLSESEGLPGVIIESLILNTPVISTNSSIGIWEIMNKKDDFVSDLNAIMVVEKGVIIPHSSQVDENNMIKNIKISIDLILDNKENFKLNSFVFLDSVSDKTAHSFYKFLKQVVS